MDVSCSKQVRARTLYAIMSDKLEILFKLEVSYPGNRAYLKFVPFEKLAITEAKEKRWIPVTVEQYSREAKSKELFMENILQPFASRVNDFEEFVGIWNKIVVSASLVRLLWSDDNNIIIDFDHEN